MTRLTRCCSELSGSKPTNVSPSCTQVKGPLAFGAAGASQPWLSRNTTTSPRWSAMGSGTSRFTKMRSFTSRVLTMDSDGM
ncbi:hypothetical protein SRABI128_05443 [Microbacterium sp. Bi128]|nr:hypothetical protein SRABI128_05443 [Microbacterium sp. Bi128]